MHGGKLTPPNVSRGCCAELIPGRSSNMPKHPFDYHRPSEKQVEQISKNRDECKALHAALLELSPSRERSLAITKLEEVSMWSNKAIIMADEGEVSDGKSEEEKFTDRVNGIRDATGRNP